MRRTPDSTRLTVPAIFGCFAGLGWHADNNGAVRFTVDDTAYRTSVVGGEMPTEEATRRIRCSFSLRDRRAIRRGVSDHVAAPPQGHIGRRRRGGRRRNDDPMIRKIRSAVAILLPVSIYR